MKTHIKTNICLHFKLSLFNAASADVNTEVDRLRRECQQLRSQLALVQSLGGIMETQPTSAQLTGMLSLTLHMCVPSMTHIGRWCVYVLHICRTSWG